MSKLTKFPQIDGQQLALQGVASRPTKSGQPYRHTSNAKIDKLVRIFRFLDP